MKALLLISTWLAALPACSDRFTEPQLLGGRLVPPETLNRGRAAFRRDCTGCHDEEPSTRAPASPSERQPRDLTLGFYKFTSVRDDGLPTDEDLARTIQGGIGLTQMGPRPDLSAAALDGLVQYVKTLSPRWRVEASGDAIPVSADPYLTSSRQAAIARGFEVYHGLAACWSCHPAYTSKATISPLPVNSYVLNGHSVEKALQLREDISHSAVVETRYGKLLPPDFLGDRVRAAKGSGGLYRTIAAGVGGTPMPSWVDRLKPEDLWAVVYYVQELIRVRGTPEAEAYRLGLPSLLPPRAEPPGLPAIPTPPLGRKGS